MQAPSKSIARACDAKLGAIGFFMQARLASVASGHGKLRKRRPERVPAAARILALPGYCVTLSAVSSMKKLVCREKSSVPWNWMRTVWPAKLVRSNVFCR